MSETTRNTIGLLILLLVVVLSFACFWKIIMSGVFEPRMIFGMFIVLAIFVLSLILALAHVTQESSYGLDIVLSCLATLSGGFAQWAFSKPNDKEPK